LENNWKIIKRSAQTIIICEFNHLYHVRWLLLRLGLRMSVLRMTN